MADLIETGNKSTDEHFGLLRKWALALSAALAALSVVSSAEMSRQRGEPETVVQEKLVRARELAELSEKLRPPSTDTKRS